jgi:FkbM family methyltransferase
MTQKDKIFHYKKSSNKYGSYCIPLSSLYTLTSSAIFNGKVHEPSTIEYILKNAGDHNIIHAGCGFGDFLPALSKLKDKTIFTFEPNRENYLCAKKTIALNNLKNIKISKFALGNKKNVARLKICENGIPLGPRSEISKNLKALNKSDFDSVKIATLDSLIPSSKKISLIHLDLEGYEEFALKGAKRIIEENKPLIILEIHSEALKYNKFMAKLDYSPIKQLIYNAGAMVFVNTVYKKCGL